MSNNKHWNVERNIACAVKEQIKQKFILTFYSRYENKNIDYGPADREK
jgi:hypothetical protein